MKQRIITRMLGINEDQILTVHYDPEIHYYWVAIKDPKGKSIVREKLFKGETAWSDAERYANDLSVKFGGQMNIQL